MKILLVDGNNQVSRMTAVYLNAMSPDKRPIGGVYGVVRAIRNQIAQQGYDAVILVIDHGIPQYRFDLFPAYKQQRKDARAKDPKQELIHARYKEQMDYIHEPLVAAGVVTARAKGWEGDDVIAALALEKFKDHKVTVMSSDKDFTALASERVTVFDPISGDFRVEDPWYTLKRCLDPKDSDNLDGVPGVGPKKADALIERWLRGSEPDKSISDVENFLAWCKRQKDDKLCQQVYACAQTVRANYAITDMSKSAKDCLPHIKYRRGQFDKVKFKRICKDMGLMPILEDFSAMFPPFSRLTCPV